MQSINYVQEALLKSIMKKGIGKKLMELWNNERMQEIRKGLMSGVYPDEECKRCHCYNEGTAQKGTL